MQEPKTFWDKTAKKYAKSPIKNIEAYNQTMERTKAHLSKDTSVLEVGCGTGSTALLLADSAKHITASDISSAMIEIAQAKAAEQQVSNVTFVEAGLPDERLNTATYDVVLAFNLLHLLEDLPAGLQQVRTLLKPGGLFISKSVCLSEKTSLLRVLVYVMRLVGLAPPVSFLTFRKLETQIADAGFDIVEAGLFPGGAMSRFVVARKI